MIGRDELIEAVTAHAQRTDVSDMGKLVEECGVDADELAALIAEIWDFRKAEIEAATFVLEPRTIYVAAMLDGFIVGVRAARAEAMQPSFQ